MSTATYDYLVLTAAITRPELHSRVFPGHLRLIGSARVKWLINVDDVRSGSSIEATIDNVRRLLTAPNIDLEFMYGTGPGCFFQAARRLAMRAGELLPQCRTGVVWLEDDWQFADRNPAEKLLNRIRLRLARNRFGDRLRCCSGNLVTKQVQLDRVTARSNPLWFVSMVSRSRVSFNPGIWSKALFERAIWQSLANLSPDQVNDPECVCADPWNERDTYRQLMVFVDPLFQDAGRQWATERGFAKWEKSAGQLAQRGTVTYVTGGAPIMPTESEALERLTGWLQLTARVSGLGVPLLARIVLRQGRLTGRVFAFPELTFDLHPVAHCTADVHLHRVHRWSRTYPFRKIDARMVWREGDERLEVKSRGRTFAGSLSRSLPSRAFLIAPFQAIIAGVFYTASLIPRLFRLDADAK